MLKSILNKLNIKIIYNLVLNKFKNRISSVGLMFGLISAFIIAALLNGFCILAKYMTRAIIMRFICQQVNIFLNFKNHKEIDIRMSQDENYQENFFHCLKKSKQNLQKKILKCLN